MPVMLWCLQFNAVCSVLKEAESALRKGVGNVTGICRCPHNGTSHLWQHYGVHCLATEAVTLA